MRFGEALSRFSPLWTALHIIGMLGVSAGKSLLMWVLLPNAWTRAELIEGSVRVLNVRRGETSVSAASGLACLPCAVSHSECFTLLGDASRDLFGVSVG